MFFPRQRYLRLIKLSDLIHAHTRQEPLKKNKALKDSYKAYFLCLEQYLGLGALLQFIPTTNARKARLQLSKKLTEETAIVNDTLRKMSYQTYATMLKQLAGTYPGRKQYFPAVELSTRPAARRFRRQRLRDLITFTETGQ